MVDTTEFAVLLGGLIDVEAEIEKAENELSVAAKYAPPITQIMKIIHKGILSLPTENRQLLTYSLLK